MAVVGTSSSLPLVHLLQVKTSEPGTYRVLVEGAKGAGTLVLHDARIVYAAYGGQQGEAAARAILFEPAIAYILTSNVEAQIKSMNAGTVDVATMDVPLLKLLLEVPVESLETFRGEAPV